MSTKRAGGAGATADASTAGVTGHVYMAGATGHAYTATVATVRACMAGAPTGGAGGAMAREFMGTADLGRVFTATADLGRASMATAALDRAYTAIADLGLAFMGIVSAGASGEPGMRGSTALPGEEAACEQAMAGALSGGSSAELACINGIY